MDDDDVGKAFSVFIIGLFIFLICSCDVMVWQVTHH